MIRYFLGRELAERLGLPLARWKRWAREFLPPDPLGGLQSGFARHYSIDEAFSVYLAGSLVSRSGFSIPEARSALAILKDWMAAQGYRIGVPAAGSGSDDGILPVREHLVVFSRRPGSSDSPAGFDCAIRGLLASRQIGRQQGQIQEERILNFGITGEHDPARLDEVLECRLICITRMLRHFARCLDLDPHLFAVLQPDTEPR